jgi:hypothetical protein
MRAVEESGFDGWTHLHEIIFVLDRVMTGQVDGLDVSREFVEHDELSVCCFISGNIFVGLVRLWLSLLPLMEASFPSKIA